MGLRLVSVIVEFLWSGEQFIDHDIQSVPGALLSIGHAVSLVCDHHHACDLYRFG